MPLSQADVFLVLISLPPRSDLSGPQEKATGAFRRRQIKHTTHLYCFSMIACQADVKSLPWTRIAEHSEARSLGNLRRGSRAQRGPLVPPLPPLPRPPLVPSGLMPG